MITPLGGLRLKRAALLAGLAVAWAGTAVPALAQDNMMEARLRRMEAEIRSLQGNKPAADGKVFTPQVTSAAAPAAAPSQPAATPMTDVLARMEAIEAQIKQLTAQSEINTNRLARLEAAVAAAGAAGGAATPAPATAAASAAAVPAAPAAPAAVAAQPAPETAAVQPAAVTQPATVSNMAAMTGGASSARPAAATGRAGAPARPSPQRLAAVSAIAKPQTNDPGDDEYSYGYRLWDAKFYPEAQQQLKLMIDKYPRHPKISFARNLLGRAYLDDGKPYEAAGWFLQNYRADKAGDRAPDSLLYLAEAMRQQRDTSRGCIALGEFAETYPREAAGRLKSQYDATRGGLKCN